jgi:phenylalanine ammonia-lyase
MLIASYLYILCQAFDLRALQIALLAGLDEIVHEELSHHFGFLLSGSQLVSLANEAGKVMSDTFEATGTLDAAEHMERVASSAVPCVVKFFTSLDIPDPSVKGGVFSSISEFCSQVAKRGTSLVNDIRRDYLFGGRGVAPASAYLNKTRPVYEFVRVTLRIPMHGSENFLRFEKQSGVAENNIGQNISLIHEVRIFFE